MSRPKPKPDTVEEKIAQKVCLWFRKQGPAVFFSHLDLMRHFSRVLRRAGLRPRLTAGFNPRPRLVFPHPMPLGIASVCETVEIEFSEERPLPEIFAALRRADGGVLTMLRCETLRPVKSGRVVAACDYVVGNLPPAATGPEFAAYLAGLLAAAEITVTRGHEEKAREVNIRPYIGDLRLTAEGAAVRLLHFPTGAGRIDEIAKLFAAQLGISWTVLTLTKTGVSFQDGKNGKPL